MSWITDAFSDYKAGMIDFPTLRIMLVEHVYPPDPVDSEMDGDNFSNDYPTIQPGSWDEVWLAMDQGDLSEEQYYAISRANDEWIKSVRKSS